MQIAGEQTPARMNNTPSRAPMAQHSAVFGPVTVTTGWVAPMAAATTGVTLSGACTVESSFNGLVLSRGLCPQALTITTSVVNLGAAKGRTALLSGLSVVSEVETGGAVRGKRSGGGSLAVDARFLAMVALRVRPLPVKNLWVRPVLASQIVRASQDTGSRLNIAFSEGGTATAAFAAEE